MIGGLEQPRSEVPPAGGEAVPIEDGTEGEVKIERSRHMFRVAVLRNAIFGVLVAANASFAGGEKSYADATGGHMGTLIESLNHIAPDSNDNAYTGGAEKFNNLSNELNALANKIRLLINFPERLKEMMDDTEKFYTEIIEKGNNLMQSYLEHVQMQGALLPSASKPDDGVEKYDMAEAKAADALRKMNQAFTDLNEAMGITDESIDDLANELSEPPAETDVQAEEPEASAGVETEPVIFDYEKVQGFKDAIKAALVAANEGPLSAEELEVSAGYAATVENMLNARAAQEGPAGQLRDVASEEAEFEVNELHTLLNAAELPVGMDRIEANLKNEQDRLERIDPEGYAKYKSRLAEYESRMEKLSAYIQTVIDRQAESGKILTSDGRLDSLLASGEYNNFFNIDSVVQELTDKGVFIPK